VTPEQIAAMDARFAERITALPGDPEYAHSAADEILCEIARMMGFSLTERAFEKLEKWYA
jgi:hypothetical protein